MLGTKRPASTGTGPLPPRGPAPSPPAGTATLRWLRLSGPQGWDTGPLPAEGSCAPAPVPSQVPPHLWPCSHVPTHLTRCPCNCLCPPCLSRCPHTQPGVSIPDLVPACPPTCHHARSHLPPPRPGVPNQPGVTTPPVMLARCPHAWKNVPMPTACPCPQPCVLQPTSCPRPPISLALVPQQGGSVVGVTVFIAGLSWPPGWSRSRGGAR